MHALLEMKDVTKRFPGVLALDNVSIRIESGEIHGLVGENGAGKSTLIKILSGAYASDSGTISIDGRVIRDITPHRMIELGVGVIYQDLALSPHLSVAENIFLGRLPKNRWGLIDYVEMNEETNRVCALLGLELDPHALVKDLSVAKRQMVEIAKALSRNARIIVLDEPTAVLGERELRGMFDIVAKLAKAGVAFIYISHRLREIFELVDNVTIMKDGRVVTTDSRKNLTIDLLVKHMVGRELKDMYPVRSVNVGKPVLKVSNLNRDGVLNDVSFTLHEGEILALSGLAGAGRTEILRAIIGVDPFEGGEIEVFGRKTAKATSTRGIIRDGVGMLPEDRKVQGLFLKQSVTLNTTIARFEDIAAISFFLSLSRERKSVLSLIRQINIRPGDPEQTVNDLSGGNQQKVVFTRWLNAKCRILLIDEPTRGIDVGAKQEIYALLGALVDRGMAILMVSSELPEVLGLSDRVLVMRRGRLAAELVTKDTTEEEIMSYAAG